MPRHSLFNDWFSASLLLLLLGPPAHAYTRRIYDCSNPAGDGLCWSELDASDPEYPTQYTPYVFGRREGATFRGPNPVAGPTYGSTDVDTAYELVPVLHQFYLDKFNRNGPNGQ